MTKASQDDIILNAYKVGRHNVNKISTKASQNDVIMMAYKASVQGRNELRNQAGDHSQCLK
jgi:hypothetical protein